MKKIATFAFTQITPVATPTDFIVIQGAAGVASRILDIEIMASESTALGVMPVNLIRRSGANSTNATLNAITGARHSPRFDNPATLVGYVSVANYGVLGTSVGVVGSKILSFSSATVKESGTIVHWDFGNSEKDDDAIVLLGTSDFICINLGGAALPAGGKLTGAIRVQETGYLI